MGLFLAYQGVQSQLQTRHPDLKDRVRVQEHHAGVFFPALTVEMDDGSKTVLSLVSFSRDSTPFWMVAGPVGTHVPRVWDHALGNAVVADAVYEYTLARMECRPETSPWKWDEPEPSEVTSLADALADAGIPVERVVAHNRLRAFVTEDGAKAKWFSRDKENFVVVREGAVAIRLSRRPNLGWLIDVADAEHDRMWRHDVAGMLDPGSEASTVPGVPHDAEGNDHLLASLVEVVGDLLRSPEPRTSAVLNSSGEPSTGGQVLPANVELHPNERLGSFVEQLNAMGFQDVRRASGREPFESERFHVVWWDKAKDLGIGGMKQLYADAMVDGKNLLVIAQGRVTRPAIEFADKAGVFAFHVYYGGHHLIPESATACDAMLDVTAAWP